MANVTFSIFALDKTRAVFAGIERNLGKMRAATQGMTTGMARAGLAFVGFSSVASVASQTLRKVREDVESIPGIPDHVKESVHLFNAAIDEAAISILGLVATGIAGFESMVRNVTIWGAGLWYGKEAADETRKQYEGIAKQTRQIAIDKANTDKVKSLKTAEQSAMEALAKARHEAFRGTVDLGKELSRLRVGYHLLANAAHEAKGEAPEAIKARTAAVEGMTENIREQARVLGQLKDQAEEADEVFKRFGGTMSASFENAVFSGGKLSEMLRGLLDDLVRFMFRETITSPLAGFLSGGLKSIFGGKRASGGPVAAGGSYLVGERGPELFTSSAAGRIISNHALGTAGAGGGAVIVNNYNSFSSGVQAAQLLPLLERAKEATIAEIQDRRARRKLA